MCLVTMTPFLRAGIRPIIGNRMGQWSDPKSTLLTLKGLPPRSQRHHLVAPPNPVLPKTMFVCCRKNFDTKTLFGKERIKIFALFGMSRSELPFILETKSTRSYVCKKTTMFFKIAACPAQRGFVLQHMATTSILCMIHGYFAKVFFSLSANSKGRDGLVTLQKMDDR